MKPLVVVVAFAAILFSCSKPAQENTSDGPDSTAVADETPVNGETVNRTPTKLTSDEMARVTAEIFLFVRADLPAYQTAYVEDIVVNGDRFKYTFIKHNGDNAGIQDNSYSGQNIPTQEEVEAWEKDSVNNPNPYSGYTRHNYDFTPEIDTFYVEGKYIAYLESAPEATPRHVTLEIVAECTHKNDARVDQETQEVKFDVSKWDIGQCMDCNISEPFIDVDFAEEHKFNRQDLYLKAKVMDLTEKDLAGLSKEDLSYIRNDIFARHGHTFKTARLIQRYSDTEWYQAVIDDASKVLNKFEKKNVDVLKKREG
jgi:hypothetical protein